MNTIDNILSRNSTPRLVEPIPSKDELEVVYQCALRAPAHAWLRPWRFIEVSGKGLDKLSKAFENTASALGDNLPERLLKYKSLPYRAPLMIVIVSDIKEHSKVPPIEQKLSAAAATQNMLLALHDMGFGAIWRTGKVSFNEVISKELELPKSNEVIGYLYIGTPDGRQKKIPELKSGEFVTVWK